jgi:peptidoglycan/xylan/chitin deacetylase (PgdA/CDA1 family)
MKVVLTFDDGYREHLKIAHFLAKHNIRATFFVITGLKEYMGRELLNPSEIKEIASMGHEIGSHTVTHIDMVKAPEDIILRELVESKEYLSKLLGTEILSFAYPYGPHNDVAAKLANSVYRIVRTTYIGSAKHYRLFDKHRCIVAFNLRLSNLYELTRLRKQDTLVLYTHLPSITKLNLMLVALKALKPRFLTLCEAFEKC